MATDLTKMIAEIDNPVILITDRKVNNIQELLPILEQVIKNGLKLVIIADDYEQEVTATLVVNKLKGVFSCVAVKAPGYGPRRKEILADIAILTGGQVISEDLGLELKDAKLSHLGKAKNIRIDKDNTTIVGGSGSKTAISERIKSLKTQIADTTSNYDREKLQERLAKISGGVAVIEIGAATEVEMQEAKHRVEDALAATKAAVEEGTVPGGGIALISIMSNLSKKIANFKDDVKTGANIVLKALEAPIRQIAMNSGVDGGVVVNTVRTANTTNYGYDALNDTYCDMIKAGIIDPTKVTRSALQNAASVAAMLLTTEGLVTDIPKEEPPMMPDGGGGMY
jgi:chaperonin GroEL